MLVACTKPVPPPPVVAVEVVELSASEARDRMNAGTLTAHALTDAYLQRIAALDKAGPTVNSIIQINPDALKDADALDAERRAGQVRGPLHGIPIVIKDNIDVAGLVNSAGSLALAAHRPQKDAPLVQQLRAAGVVILAKSNLSEWANFRSTHSTSGWSSRGGQTRNPYALDRNPCGSSSGTAAAVAASFAAIGIGTETDGSIICPSAVTGLVGLKPTVGLVSRDGIIPISATQDTAGPMGRTVTDVAMLLTAMAARKGPPYDADVPANERPEGGHLRAAATNYATGLSSAALRGKRFGLIRKVMGSHDDVDAAAERAVEAIRMAGGEVVDVQFKTLEQWNDAETEVLLYEFKDGLNRYLADSHAPVRSLADLIAWNKANADRAMPHFGQELFEMAEKKGPLTDAAYLNARATARRLAWDEGLKAVLDGNRLDATIAPSTSLAWPIDYLLGDRFVGIGGYGAAAVAGTPSITLPIGSSHGLPIGLTFMGGADTEQDLLGFAYALEQILKARQPPQFAPTVP
jgi:amidase